jgi:integrase/recombinase XerD
MKVTAILKGNTDEHGRKTVYIRINEGKKRTFHATKIKVLPTQFEKGIVVKHPQAKLYNDLLRAQLVKYESQALTNEVRKFPDSDFRTYLNKCLNQWDRSKSFATLQQFRTEGNKFLEFAGDIKLSRITLDLLNEYKGHLFNSGYEGNTVAKSFKNLKTLLKKAVAERVIEFDPFALFEPPKYKNPKRDYVTKEHREKLFQYVDDKTKPLTFREITTWFLIGCYAGLRHSDMRVFNKKEHIREGRLVMETVKTKDIIGMPVKGRLKELLELVDYQPLKYSNQKCNDYIKEVAKDLELGIYIHWHMSRHTFAVRCADAGISPEVTARLMGIRSLKTIAIYYKISNKRIDNELDKLED